MDLRAEMDKLLIKYGHDIYLQRRIVRSGDGVYQYRDNKGFDTKLEIHTVRMRLPGQASQGVQELAEGLFSNVDRIYYFRWNANPNFMDRIYDGDPTGNEFYYVQWNHPLRGLSGRIEYWIVGASRSSKDRV